MGLESFTKQPYEEFFVAIDFSTVVDTLETLVLGSCDAVAEDSSGADVTATVLEIGTINIDEHTLKVRVRAGVHGEKYKLTYTVVTNLGNKFEDDIKMIVKQK